MRGAHRGRARNACDDKEARVTLVDKPNHRCAIPLSDDVALTAESFRRQLFQPVLNKSCGDSQFWTRAASHHHHPPLPYADPTEVTMRHVERLIPNTF